MSRYYRTNESAEVLGKLVGGILGLGVVLLVAYFVEQWRADVWASAMERHHVQGQAVPR